MNPFFGHDRELPALLALLLLTGLLLLGQGGASLSDPSSVPLSLPGSARFLR